MIKGDYEGAIEIFDKLDSFRDRYFFQGITKAKLGDYSGAVEAFEKFSPHINRDGDDLRSAKSVVNTCKGLA